MFVPFFVFFGCGRVTVLCTYVKLYFVYNLDSLSLKLY